MSQARPVLRLIDGQKSLGLRPLFTGAQFWLSPGEKAILVGPNGAGKSTLFQVLAGRQTLDQGRVERLEPVFYLPQDFRPTGGSVLELAHRVTPLARAEQAAARAAPDQLAEAWAEVQALRFWQKKVPQTLLRFGLDKPLWDQPADRLSGGQGVRLGLALAFLSDAPILLLDEPTTHLDLPMRLTLEHYLRQFSGALALITHDRALMRSLASTVYHLEQGQLLRVPGGFERYLTEKTRIQRTLARAAQQAQQELDRLTGQLPDQRRPGRDRRSAQKSALMQRASKVAVVAPPPPERRWGLELAAESTPLLVAEGRNLKVNLGAHTVIEQASYRLFRGDRVALLGSNGSGKTTLLRLILGQLLPTAGQRDLRPGVRAGYLEQLWHGLEPHRPLLQQFVERFGEARAMAILGPLGFRPPQWNQTPHQLSGGERARAGLGLLGALRVGLLVLDEPTNHLELELLEALEQALIDYPGTVLLVSHDRELVRRVATRFWGLEKGKLVEYAHYTLAEAALLGQKVPHLNPLGEESPEAPPGPPPDPEQLRLELLHQLEDPRLSARERGRLRANLLAVQETIDQAAAQRHYQPAPYIWTGVWQGQPVFADAEGDHWQFWSRQGQVWGNLEDRRLALEAAPPRGLRGALLHLAFERLDIDEVAWPGQVTLRQAILGRLAVLPQRPFLGWNPDAQQKGQVKRRGQQRGNPGSKGQRKRQ